jgi:hypothetical protein
MADFSRVEVPLFRRPSSSQQLAEVGAGERTSVFAAEMRCTPRTLVASPYKVDIQWDGGRNGGFSRENHQTWRC